VIRTDRPDPDFVPTRPPDDVPPAAECPRRQPEIHVHLVPQQPERVPEVDLPGWAAAFMAGVCIGVASTLLMILSARSPA
jgi:hypothetical protein